MKGGLLQEVIQIITPVVTKNAYGEETTEWQEKLTLRANLTHKDGTRTNTNGEIFYTSTKIFEVRFYADIDEYDRIVWEDKIYRIINIEPNRKVQKKTIISELVND